MLPRDRVTNLLDPGYVLSADNFNNCNSFYAERNDSMGGN